MQKEIFPEIISIFFFKLDKTYKIKVPMILINQKQISLTQNISRDTIIKLVKKKKKDKNSKKKDTCYVGKQTHCKILTRNDEILKSME